MKNEFNIDVSFDRVVVDPYNWESTTFISKIPVIRVSSKCIKDILTYESTIKTDKTTLLLSDTKLSVALRIKSNKIVARSYLDYDKDLEVCEYACNLKITHLDYQITKPIKYKIISEEEKMRDYIIDSIKNIQDDNKIKYLYYLYFNTLDDYSKERLVKGVKHDSSDNIQKLYDFLNNVKS